MCGIAGRYARHIIPPREAAELSARMQAALRLRGPDSGAMYHDQDVALVHRRLSIIDLSSAGAQPLWNENGEVCVIVNGEVYNYRELRRTLQTRGHRFRSHSDSEVLVHLYEDGGIDACCRAVHGMFAFALWDARSRDLYLVRDRLGIKPLVLAEHEAGVTFASTLDGLLADERVPPALNTEALVSVLRWGFVPTPWSAVAAARHLAPGTWLRVRAGRVVEHRRWWTDAPTAERVADDDVREAIRRAVASHLVADVPVATLLSGGVDSGLVSLLAAAESHHEALQGFTVSHRGHPEDEWADAQSMADQAGIRLREVAIGGAGLTSLGFESVVAAMDEPLATSSMVGLWELFRAIAPEQRVVLSGDGGDELFGGYDWHVSMPGRPLWAANWLFRAAAPMLAVGHGLPGRVGSLGRLAALSRRHPASIYLDKLRLLDVAELGTLGLAPDDGEPIESIAREAWDRYATRGVLEQMLAVDRATALVDEMLAKVDAASMNHSIEARVPLLDDGVVAAATALPPERKRHGRIGKVCLREWLATMGAAGASARRKTGFNSPLADWLNGPASDHLQGRIADGMALLGLRHPPASVRGRFALAVIAAWVDRADRTSPSFSPSQSDARAWRDRSAVRHEYVPPSREK
jgi:asparagine synthase (glutamine-hydrolysing)